MNQDARFTALFQHLEGITRDAAQGHAERHFAAGQAEQILDAEDAGLRPNISRQPPDSRCCCYRHPLLVSVPRHTCIARGGDREGDTVGDDGRRSGTASRASEGCFDSLKPDKGEVDFVKHRVRQERRGLSLEVLVPHCASESRERCRRAEHLRRAGVEERVRDDDGVGPVQQTVLSQVRPDRPPAPASTAPTLLRLDRPLDGSLVQVDHARLHEHRTSIDTACAACTSRNRSEGERSRKANEVDGKRRGGVLREDGKGGRGCGGESEGCRAGKEQGFLSYSHLLLCGTRDESARRKGEIAARLTLIRLSHLRLFVAIRNDAEKCQALLSLLAVDASSGRGLMRRRTLLTLPLLPSEPAHDCTLAVVGSQVVSLANRQNRSAGTASSTKTASGLSARRAEGQRAQDQLESTRTLTAA